MTSYFSIEIKDLEGVYSVTDYWYSFAVIMSISFLFLFFFSRLLMYITESLDSAVKKSGQFIIDQGWRKAKDPEKDQ